MNLKLNKKFIEDLEGLIEERRGERIKNKLIKWKKVMLFVYTKI